MKSIPMLVGVKDGKPIFADVLVKVCPYVESGKVEKLPKDTQNYKKIQ